MTGYQSLNAASATRPLSERVARHPGWPLLLGAGAIVAVGFTHLIDFGVYHLRYRILNANSAGSWSHGVSALAIGIGAAVCVVGARRSPGERAVWTVAAAILALFFIDEVSGVHASIGNLSHGKLLYAPALAALAYCVWQLTKGGAYRACVRASAGLLLTSYVIHVLGPRNIARTLGWRANGWDFQVVVALKEGTELAGVLLALMALWGAASAARQSESAAGSVKPACP